MKTITLRNIPSEVEQKIEEAAQKNGLSLNQATLQLLAEGLGLKKNNAPVKYRDLSEFSGRWTNDEKVAFDKLVAEQRTIDPEMWK